MKNFVRPLGLLLIAACLWLIPPVAPSFGSHASRSDLLFSPSIAAAQTCTPVVCATTNPCTVTTAFSCGIPTACTVTFGTNGCGQPACPLGFQPIGALCQPPSSGGSTPNSGGGTQPTGSQSQSYTCGGQVQPIPCLATTSVNTLIVFTPGINPLQLPVGASIDFPVIGSTDPYINAMSTFRNMIGDIPGCDNTDRPVIYCDNGVAWVPYSYKGAGQGQSCIQGGTVESYVGRDTGQHLATSVSMMESVVGFAKTCLGMSRSTKVIVIGHSLGGAIATMYAAQHPDVTAVSLDAPIAGTFPNDSGTLALYCKASAGLPEFTNNPLCSYVTDALVLDMSHGFVWHGSDLVAHAPAVNSDVYKDLSNPALQNKMQVTNAYHFANPADAVIPSWTALDHAHPDRNVLLMPPVAQPDDCGDLGLTNHGCINDNQMVRDDIRAIIESPDTWKAPGFDASAPYELTVSIINSDSSACQRCAVAWDSHDEKLHTVTDEHGVARLTTVPWQDGYVVVSDQDDVVSYFAALPSRHAEVTLNVLVTDLGGTVLSGN
jgi:pimeloyl-ACP methyl ester carboxylesterase